MQRATRGKALKFSFGASIHRVVGLDLADAVFEPGTSEMRTQWKPRIDKLLDELAKGAAMLRLSYIADIEDEDARRRAPRRDREADQRGVGGTEGELPARRSSRRCSGGAAGRPSGPAARRRQVSR